MNPTVSLCMIVRNEESNLKDCLSGLCDLFDEIVIVDTGSTDSTRDVARQLGAKVFDFPWVDDFSAARNESRRHATGDWIFWMDADDRIDSVNRQRLAVLFRSLEQYDPSTNPVFQMVCQWRAPGADFDTAVIQCRLFARAANVSWQRPIHEDIVCDDPTQKLSTYFYEAAIRHSGYSDPAMVARKNCRDRRLLERELLLNPDDCVSLYYLARLNLNQQRYYEALKSSRRGVAKDPDCKVPITPFSMELIAIALEKLDRRTEAIEWCKRALDRLPHHLPLLSRLGSLLHRADRFAEAERCYRRILSDSRYAGLSGGGVTPGLDLGRTLLDLASALMDQRRWAEADPVLRQTLQLAPHCVEAWERLGFVCLQTGRRTDCEAVLQGLADCPNTEMQQASFRAQRCLFDGSFDEARRWINRAMAMQPDALGPWLLLSDLLFREGGDPGRCIEVHRKALALDPSRTVLRQRLALLEAQASRDSIRVSARVGAFAIASGSTSVVAYGA